MSLTGVALAQTLPTPPSAYATQPTFPSAFATAPSSPCLLRRAHGGHRYRGSPYNPTSPCFSDTPYPEYSAFEPFEKGIPPNRPPLPGAASLNEREATERIKAKGYLNVTRMVQDQRGIWRGQATMKDGRAVDVVLDLDGNIYSELSTLYIRIEPAPPQKKHF